MFAGEKTLDRVQVVKIAQSTSSTSSAGNLRSDGCERIVMTLSLLSATTLRPRKQKVVCRCFDVVLHEVLFSPALQCFDHVRKTWVQLCLRRL
jgi:hypothetical protein